MIDTLRYGLDETLNMTLDVPQEVFDATIRSSDIGEILDRPERVVTAEAHEDGMRLIFESNPFEGLKDRQDSDVIESYAKQWLYAFVKVRQNTPEGMTDPRMDIHMNLAPSHDASGMQRRGVHAKLKWPLNDYSVAQHKAVLAMRHTARTLKYLPEDSLGAIYANVSFEYGVDLCALDMGAISLLTDGMYYRADRNNPSINLLGTNMYDRRLVLTSLSGLIALAEEQ